MTDDDAVKYSEEFVEQYWATGQGWQDFEKDYSERRKSMSESEDRIETRGRRSRKAGKGIQGDLNIPGDEKYRPKIPKKLKDLLEPYCEVIAKRAELSSQEDEYKKSMMRLMVKHQLTEVMLPNGGSIIYKPGKPSVKYLPPKAQKGDGVATDDSDDTGGDE